MKKQWFMICTVCVLALTVAVGLSACGESKDPLDESLAPVNGAAAHEGDFNESELLVENGGQVSGLQVIYEKLYTMKTYDPDVDAEAEEEAAEAEAKSEADAETADAEGDADKKGANDDSDKKDDTKDDADKKDDAKDDADNADEAAEAEAAEPGVTKQAMMLIGVRNNSDKTLDFTFKDSGVDKKGNKVTCKDKKNVIYAVGPGETRYFQQRIKVEGDDVANIDHMSGNKNKKRFKVTDSTKVSFKNQVSIDPKCRNVAEGIWHIFGTNNSEYTGRTEVGAIFLKEGEPVYYSTTPLCNLSPTGRIAWLEPGESTEAGTFLPCGGNEYDEAYMFVIAYTSAQPTD